jgi:hypothetical protein
VAVPDLTPTPTQTLYAYLAIDAEGRCVSEQTVDTFGWWAEDDFVHEDPVVPVEARHGTPLMLGAFVQEDRAEGFLFRDGVHAWIGIPPAPPEPPAPEDPEDTDDDRPEHGPDPGPPEWTRFELGTGLWHADDAATWDGNLAVLQGACVGPWVDRKLQG